MPDVSLTISPDPGDLIDSMTFATRLRHGFFHERMAFRSIGPGGRIRVDHGPKWRIAGSMNRGTFQQETWEHYTSMSRPDCVANFLLRGGRLTISAYAAQPSAAFDFLHELLDQYPEYEPVDPDQVPVTFWSNSVNGPRSLARDLDADAWVTISGNYQEDTRENLYRLIDVFPPVGGQLLLMHGPPGTGKTTFLRCLAREWREHADLHYIVDPEEFFGASANYLIDVLLGGEMRHNLSDDFDDDEPKEPRWRIILLEDCGEMLASDARQQVGQALSRLLNSCDGLIGRGLRVLVAITTNEPLAKLNEAIARPGRCAARVEFRPFSMREANEWLDARGLDPVDHGQTLAELYALAEDRGVAAANVPIGFAS